MRGHTEYADATFTDAVSNKIQLGGKKVLGLLTPASLGGTTITFNAGILPSDTFVQVRDETNTAILVNVDATSSYYYDLTNIFPASLEFITLSCTSATNGKVIKLALQYT